MRTGTRKVLTVLFTDVVGFTSLMERSESRALEALGTLHSLQMPLLKKHGGNLIKEMGDGTLCTFPSSSDAVRFSREMQHSLREMDFRIRIGIHRGRVFMGENDVLGDPVNVTARVQEHAPPGGICVTGEVLRNYGPGRKPSARPMGLTKLKGLGRLVDLFAIRGTSRSPMPVGNRGALARSAPVGPGDEHTTIAVMPLLNLGPEEDEFYCYSISSDLVSDLSKAGGLLITPLSDVIRLKQSLGSAEKVRERLGVRFLVRGTFWRKDTEFLLSMELQDLKNDRLVWSDNWIDLWYDLPSIKGKLADGLLKAMGIDSTWKDDITEDETSASETYEEYLRALDLYRRRKTAADVDRVHRMIEKALASDPEMVPAMILLGRLYCEGGNHREAAEMLEAACRAATGKDDTPGLIDALTWIGINQWKQWDLSGARKTFMRTMRMSRSMNDVIGVSRSLSNIALIDSNSGRYGRSLTYLEKALEVFGADDVSSLKANILCNIGLTHWHLGDNALALRYYSRALELYEMLEDRAGKAYILRNIGILKRSAGLYQEALELIEQALGLQEELDDAQGQCHSLNSMGNMLFHLGQYSRATAYFKKSLSIATRTGDRFTQGILKTNLGNIHSAGNEHDKALELHTEALEISVKLDDREGIAENLSLIGDDHRRLGNLEEAVKAYGDSIEIMDKMGASGRTALTRARLAEVLLASPAASMDDHIARTREVESLLDTGSSDRVEVLWVLYLLHRRMAETFPQLRDDLEKRGMDYLRQAHETLMEICGNLKGKDSRNSFLNNVRVNANIIEAFGAGPPAGKR